LKHSLSGSAAELAANDLQPKTVWRPYPNIHPGIKTDGMTKHEAVRLFLKRVGQATRTEIAKAIGGDASSLTKVMQKSGVRACGFTTGRNGQPLTIYELEDSQ